MMKLFKTLTSQLFILLVGVALVSCQWSERTSTSLSVGFGGGQKVSFARNQMISKAAIDQVYPTLSAILLSVSTPTLNTRQINNQYNGGRLTLNAAGTAIILTDTVVELVVPNSELLTLEIQAINLDGYKVFSGEIELSPLQLAKPTVAVAVPLEVDVDTSIPVLASISGCTDSDSDDLCDVYEDLFLNAAGVADIDGDGQLNKNDTDADDDGVPDYDDRNSSLTSGNGPTPSNNGYPMFIVANRSPLLSDVSVTTSENQSFTLSLPASLVDEDVNDEVSYFVVSDPINGEATVSGTDIIYSPNAFYIGSDSFTVEAYDLASSYTEESVPFTVSVSVIDNPSVANSAPIAIDDANVQSTPGAHIEIDVLANDTDPDIEIGLNDSISLIDATADKGDVYISADSSKLYFRSERTDSGTSVVTYTIQDSQGASASAQVTVVLNIDADGDGLSESVYTNGASVLDVLDTTSDEDGDGYSDWFEAFNSDTSGTTVSANINVDTRWTISGSPYLVTSNVFVFPPAHLIIDQGVVVRFASGTSLSILDGANLTVLGGDTLDLGVVFTSNNDQIFQVAPDTPTVPSAGDWTGLELATTESVLIVGAGIYFAKNNLIVNEGSHLIVDSIFSNAEQAGLQYNSNLGSQISKNNFSHNSTGIHFLSSGSQTVLSHSFVVWNSGGDAQGNGGGVLIESDIEGSIMMSNIYISQNDAPNEGSGMWIGSNSKVSVLGSSFQYNGMNYYNLNSIAIDASVDDLDLLTVKDTVFDDNYGEVNDDVNLTATATASDLTAVLTAESTNNWVDEDSGNSGLSDDGTQVFAGYLANAMESDGSGYLVIDSSAIDKGSADDLSSIQYLSETTTPTTLITGELDSGVLDIGFHHSRKIFQVDANKSAVQPSSFTINQTQHQTILAKLIDSNDMGADMFNNVNVSSASGSSSTFLLNQRYLPGGNYAFSVEHAEVSGGVDSFTVWVNGVAGPVSSGTLNP